MLVLVALGCRAQDGPTDDRAPTTPSDTGSTGAPTAETGTPPVATGETGATGDTAPTADTGPAGTPPSMVDVLFVVDDSSSMTEEQFELSTSVGAFVTAVVGVDPRFGVITTSFDYADPDRGRLVGSPPMLDLSQVSDLILRVQAGTAGSDKEKPLEAAAYAIDPAGPNAGELRAGARLVVVVISDEEDCSDGGALEGQPATACYTELGQLTPVADLVAQLAAWSPDAQVHGIVGLPTSTCPDQFPSARIAEAATLTGGTSQDLCDNDWGPALAQIGDVAAAP
jgi:hypothetical protein